MYLNVLGSAEEPRLQERRGAVVDHQLRPQLDVVRKLETQGPLGLDGAALALDLVPDKQRHHVPPIARRGLVLDCQQPVVRLPLAGGKLQGAQV